MRKTTRAALIVMFVATTAACTSPAKAPAVASAPHVAPISSSSSSAGGVPTASGSPRTLTNVDKANQFAQCMRDHGFPFPNNDKVAEQGGMVLSITDSPEYFSALDKCRPLLPAAAPPTADPKRLAQLRTYAKCMRAYGIKVPDPDPNSLGISDAGTQDPGYPAAQAACKDDLPGDLGGRQ